MKIFLPQETLSVVKSHYVFLDTCILLDFAVLKPKDKEKFIDKLNLLIQEDCELITINLVVIEFLIGSSVQDIKTKRKYLGLLTKIIIPERGIKPENIESLIAEYGENARGSLSCTDLHLGAAIKQFPNSLVLTRNYKDFPAKIFSCLGVLSLSLEKDVRTYSFYEYERGNPPEIVSQSQEIPF